MTSQYSRFGRFRANGVPKHKPFPNKKAFVLATCKLLAISAVFLAWAGSASTLVAEDHSPLLLDLSQLKLKVSSSEVVHSVCNISGGCVYDKEGENRLVVVA